MTENASELLMAHNRDATKARLIEQLENMPIVEIACKRVNVSRATYYRWLKVDHEFAAKCAEALDRSTSAVSDIAEAKLITAIQEGNMTAISFWLRNRHRAYQTKVNIQGTIHHQTEALTKEQSQLVERALRFAGLIEYEEENHEKSA